MSDEQYCFYIHEEASLLKSIYYSPCPCKEKYYLDPANPLTKYLENECKGWVVANDHRYRLNYLLLILIANFKKKQFLKFNDTFDYYYLKGDQKLSSLLGESHTSLLSFRSFVNETFFGGIEKDQLSLFSTPLFLCVDQKLVRPFLDQGDLNHYVRNQCE